MTKPSFPYTTYSYLTRIDFEENPKLFMLKAVLWMPANYSFELYDNEPPEGVFFPEIYYFRIVLKDLTPDKDDDVETCRPMVFEFNNIQRVDGKDVVEVYYKISNEERPKIPKKAKSKMAYAHADIGGAGPGPQPPEQVSA